MSEHSSDLNGIPVSVTVPADAPFVFAIQRGADYEAQVEDTSDAVPMYPTVVTTRIYAEHDAAPCEKVPTEASVVPAVTRTLWPSRADLEHGQEW